MKYLAKCLFIFLLIASSYATALFSPTIVSDCYKEHAGLSDAITVHNGSTHHDDTISDHHTANTAEHKHCHKHHVCCSTSTIFHTQTMRLKTPDFRLATEVFAVSAAIPTASDIQGLFRPPRVV